MATVLNSTNELYSWLMSKGDARSANWPLMGSPFPILTIIFTYIYFVKVMGPKFMKAKQPYQIEPLIIAYNVLMVILSAFFFFYGGSLTYLPGGKYNFICEPVDYSESVEAMKFLRLGWWFLILKIAELLDTVFFVLRKKFTHISALHVVHHSLVAWGVWIGLKFGGGGHNAFFPFINCGVHMIMYSYYCLAALGPQFRKYLWWKKALTIIQMVQFVVALIHACLPLYVDCGYQPFFAYTLIAHAVLFWVMFYNFYNKSYNSRQHNNGTSIKMTYSDNCHASPTFKKSSTNGTAKGTNGKVSNGTNSLIVESISNGGSNGEIVQNGNGKVKQG